LFPGYELIEEIARGGMGVVFRARQFRPERVVALKVIASGELASPKMVERFHTEAETAARLEHPNIVPIFEVGSEGHWHFFSMRLIEGTTLAEVLGKARMPPRDAAALMVKIARAVQYAHSRGVLHRDIKPGNILIDAEGEPHLTDFGLAKVLEGDSDITHSEAVLGTPAYMAPEQASGNTRDATTAADVYALGSVFYEALAGRPPFAAESTPALLRKIVETEPKPPSASPTHGSKSWTRAESAEWRVLRKSSFVNPSDLDSICLKCLEKKPALRYRSAEQFADDLERALLGEPILARPSTATQRFGKWVRRDPTRAALVGTLVLAGFLLTIVSLAFNVRLTRARNKALTSEATARGQLLSAHLRENAKLNAAGNALLGMLPLIEAARIPEDDPVTRGRVRERLSAILRFSPHLLRLWDAGGTPVQLRFSNDGRRLLAVLRSGEPRAWDLSTGQPIRHPSGADRTCRASFIEPDGSRVLEYFTNEPYAGLWNITAGTFTPMWLKSDGDRAGAFSPDGKIIATGGEQVRLWDAASGKETSVAITNNPPCLWLMFSPDGEQLITGHAGEQAWRWNVRTGARLNSAPLTIWPGLLPHFSLDGSQLQVGATTTVQILKWPLGEVTCAVPVGTLLDMNLCPDGRQFVTAGFQEQARVWDSATGHSYRLPLAHESGANKAVFSPDGALLATAGFDYQLRIVLASNHRPLFPAIQHASLIEAVTFSPDSRFLSVGDVAGIVQVWDLRTAGRPFLPQGQPMRRVANSQDGKWLVGLGVADELHLCDLTTGAEIGQLSSVPSGRSQISIDPTGRFIAGAFGANGVRVWDFSTRKVIHEIVDTNNPATRVVGGVVFKPDGSEFVTMTPNGLLQRWGTVNGKPVGPLMDRGERSFLLYWSADGRWIASGGNSSVTICDAQTSLQLGAPIRCRTREMITEVRFSPDSKRLVVGFGNATVEPATAQLYELPSLRAVGTPLRHGDGVGTATFSFDGNFVATGGEDNMARIWRVADGEPVTGALPHNAIVSGVTFSHDSRLLATGSADGAIRLWDVERGELMAPPVQFAELARPLCFTPDNRKLFVSVSGLGETVWSIDLTPADMPLEKLQTLAECQAGLRAGISQGATPLSPSELAAKFSSLAANDLALIMAEDARRWHFESATVAERQGAWFTAAFHLERLLAAHPHDPALKERFIKAQSDLHVRPR
jgi:WD40 repeat protein